MSRLSPNKLRKGLAALALAGAIASGAAGMASHAVWASDMEISRVSDQGKQILALDLEVAQDMAALQRLIQRTLPGSHVTVDTIGDNVVLGG